MDGHREIPLDNIQPSEEHLTLVFLQLQLGIMAFSPGLDVQANSPQGQTVQCSEKLQGAQILHVRLHRPQLECSKD